MNVAIYLRKSREELEESREETLARHERILFDYCKKNNLTITNIFKEVVSGESIANRPQMQLLLEDVKDNKYDGVVIVELERLSRGNQIDQAEILEIFKKSKTKIYTLNKIYDLSSEDDFDEEFFEFGLFMSRREYKIIKRRLMRGKRQAFKEGYFTSATCPYGFTKERRDKGFVLIPDEQESEIVKSIFNKYVIEDLGIADICRWLNTNGIKPRKANHWTFKSIKMILRNKTYLGYLGFDNYSSGPRQFIKGKHDGFIDENIFEIAQNKLESKMTKKKVDSTLVNPMATFLKCGVCGKTMRSSFDVKLQKYVLKCLTFECPTISSRLNQVEEQLIFELQQELNNYNYFLENYSDEIEKKRSIIESEKKIINTEISKKETMIDKCCELLEEGIYTKEKYLNRVNILEEELKALKLNLEAINSTSFEETDRYEKAIPILKNVLIKYNELNPKEKNDILKSIIDKVEYTKSKRNTRHNIDTKLFDLKIFLKI